MASLSAARWASELGWRETWSMFLACGREESAQERLGRATRCSALLEEEDLLMVVVGGDGDRDRCGGRVW